mmetsp:Transcript_41164/g.92805  ORF Transcript_41164/g.92805 Transcript_41164/m.92805 type:complete len:306 (+) Transcript_41164:1040-1957(+)
MRKVQQLHDGLQRISFLFDLLLPVVQGHFAVLVAVYAEGKPAQLGDAPGFCRSRLGLLLCREALLRHLRVVHDHADEHVHEPEHRAPDEDGEEAEDHGLPLPDGAPDLGPLSAYHHVEERVHAPGYGPEVDVVVEPFHHGTRHDLAVVDGVSRVDFFPHGTYGVHADDREHIQHHREERHDPKRGLQRGEQPFEDDPQLGKEPHHPQEPKHPQDAQCAQGRQLQAAADREIRETHEQDRQVEPVPPRAEVLAPVGPDLDQRLQEEPPQEHLIDGLTSVRASLSKADPVALRAGAEAQLHGVHQDG